ncbi:hypothetical protein ACJJTC_004809 [Scirpophaga incertulas]
MPQDSDSGISTDGFQQLEELQCELREKSHEVLQLRSQLDFTDRQHEEALTALTTDVIPFMLREENITLMHIRRDYDDACEKLTNTERALEESRQELDSLRRRGKTLAEQTAVLENEKLTLQEQVTKSKAECHRINEIYASRQATLLEKNEALAATQAELSTKVTEQDRLLQQLSREKVLLEIELKDVLNKSEQPQLIVDRSVDVSYTEDQMLTALDSLNADSRFSQDNNLLDEDSFVNALKEDPGRATNISLFDEIRLSFYSNARQNPTDLFSNCNMCNDFDKSVDNAVTQTDNSHFCCTSDIGIQTDDNLIDKNVIDNKATKTNSNDSDFYVSSNTNEIGIQTYINKFSHDLKHIATQTDILYNNNNESLCTDCYKCKECSKIKKEIEKVTSEIRIAHQIVTDVNLELSYYEANMAVLQKLVSEGNGRNCLMQTTITDLQSKIVSLQTVCANQTLMIGGWNCEMCSVQCQTDVDVISVSTQVEAPCIDCQKRNLAKPYHSLKYCFWKSTKWLFQLFAVVCFVCALLTLYGVARKPRCREAVPWRWLLIQDFLDVLLRVEYGTEVPM